MFDVFSAKFAHDIVQARYAWPKADGTKETWAEICRRVVDSVCGSLISEGLKSEMYGMFYNRRGTPGGRYLANAGRPYHQISSCYLYRAEDSREGWGSLFDRGAVSLMTGGGIGVDYSDIRPRGSKLVRGQGHASGPCSLAKAVNEVGREVRDGGARRSAIWAGLRWNHADIPEWMGMKQWPAKLRALKVEDPDFHLPMELTNISNIYDKEFFDLYAAGNEDAKAVWRQNTRQSMIDGEPGFSINYKNARESLRNAPVSADTLVMTVWGETKIGTLLGRRIDVWTGKRWVETEFKLTAHAVQTVSIQMSNGRTIRADPSHEFFVCSAHEAWNIHKVRADRLEVGEMLLVSPPSEMVAEHVTIQHIEPGLVEDVYCCDVKVPEHSFMAEGVIISNCTEVVSEDDSDKCNLGTVWLGRYQDIRDYRRDLELMTIFLLCGGIYTDNPTPKITEVGRRNNRIGVGLGGFFEWLLTRGHEFEVTPDLHEWLGLYQGVTDETAWKWSKILGVEYPKGRRAIAPNGTISIIAEQNSSIEPLFCAACKRGYINEGKHVYQYVIDASARRLLETGVPLERIERNDAYSLNLEQRVKFQADVQDYTDMSVASTVNIDAWGTERNHEGLVDRNAEILFKYGPRLRGITMYPDGARDGQPLVKVPVSEAEGREGVIYELKEDRCSNGVCGI